MWSDRVSNPGPLTYESGSIMMYFTVIYSNHSPAYEIYMYNSDIYTNILDKKWHLTSPRENSPKLLNIYCAIQ